MSAQVTFTSEDLVLIVDALRYWCDRIDRNYNTPTIEAHLQAGYHVRRRAVKLADKIDAVIEAVNAEPAP